MQYDIILHVGWQSTWHSIMLFISLLNPNDQEVKIMASSSDKRKQSLYFPEKMLHEIQAEAVRQDRSLSWIVQQAWKIARPTIARYAAPGVDDSDHMTPDDSESGS